MDVWGWRLRFLGLAMLAACLTASTGCMGCLHPMRAPQAELRGQCQELPKCCRDHVYVFILNGLDPGNFANVTGLRDHLNELGFRKTYYGQVYHIWHFQDEICRLHQEDPDARFVLIGFSLGANLVFNIASGVETEGVQIDTIVLLSGNHPVMALPSEKPANVCRVLNILVAGTMQAYGERDWAENLRLDGAWHFDSPSHPITQDCVCRALAELAAQAPIVEPPPELVPEQGPTPRPLEPRAEAPADEWDFLKPVSRLRESSAPATGPQTQANPLAEHLRTAYSSWRQGSTGSVQHTTSSKLPLAAQEAHEAADSPEVTE